jgi:hypothetical protein
VVERVNSAKPTLLLPRPLKIKYINLCNKVQVFKLSFHGTGIGMRPIFNEGAKWQWLPILIRD